MKKLMIAAVAVTALGSVSALAQGAGQPAPGMQPQAQPGQTAQPNQPGGCSCCKNMMQGMMQNVPKAPDAPNR